MTSRTKYNNPVAAGALGLPYHYEMVSDSNRVDPFKAAIERVCPGARVLESGTGSGILSLLAARAGAERVYTVDLDPQVGALATENIRRSGFDNVVFLQRSILDVSLADLDGRRPDVIIAENLSTWQVTEPQILVLNHVNQNLAHPDTIRLPARMANELELTEAQFWFEELVEVRTHYFQFSGIRAPRVLSAPALFTALDLGQVNPTRFSGTVEVSAHTAGTLNSLRLTSPFTIHEEITCAGTDSVMPPVVVPLREDLKVTAGDRIRVTISYDTATSWEAFACSAELL